MATTVLDSTDTAGILADAGFTIEGENEHTQASGSEGKTQADAQKLAGDGKAVEKNDKSDEGGEEDENGLTEAERKELTEKMQKAIGKKHRMLKEAEEFAASQYSERRLAEQRAEALEREMADLRAKLQPQKVEAAPAKPKREDFASESEYIDATIEWGVQEGMRKQAEQSAKEAAERAQAQLIEAAKARIAKAMELVPNFEEVTSKIDHEVPPVVASYMQKSEMFAELGYHLAKNPDLILSLAKLPPDEQLVKIGKIESKLTPFGSEKTQDDTQSSKTNSNGRETTPAPSADTGTAPSKARSTAPVITPLNQTGSAHEKDPKDFNVREVISDYAKRNQVNFSLRKRH